MEALILTWLLNHNVPVLHAKALVKRATIESGPSANPPKTGLGNCLFQWTGARYTRLKHWSKSKDCPKLTLQLEFALKELHEPYFSCFWTTKAANISQVLTTTFAQGRKCPQ